MLDEVEKDKKSQIENNESKRYSSKSPEFEKKDNKANKINTGNMRKYNGNPFEKNSMTLRTPRKMRNEKIIEKKQSIDTNGENGSRSKRKKSGGRGSTDGVRGISTETDGEEMGMEEMLRIILSKVRVESSQKEQNTQLTEVTENLDKRGEKLNVLERRTENIGKKFKELEENLGNVKRQKKTGEKEKQKIRRMWRGR